MSSILNELNKEKYFKRIIKKYFKRKSVTQFGDDGKVNSSKIEEMCESYDESGKHYHLFLSCALIAVARIIVGDQEDYYLVDGQHRIIMALDLLEKNDDNKPLIIINMKNYVIENKKNGDKILIKSK